VKRQPQLDTKREHINTRPRNTDEVTCESKAQEREEFGIVCEYKKVQRGIKAEGDVRKSTTQQLDQYRGEKKRGAQFVKVEKGGIPRK